VLLASTHKERLMERTETRPTGAGSDVRDVPLEAPTTVALSRRPRARVAVVSVIVALLVAGGVTVALLAGGGEVAPDAPAQAEGDVTVAGMTDAELSLRLSLEAARDARLAAASRMTDAERSLRMHLEAAREVTSR
jgi:hypothetical protein